MPTGCGRSGPGCSKRMVGWSVVPCGGAAVGPAPSALDALDVLPGVADPRAGAGLLLRSGHADFSSAGEPASPAYTIRVAPGWRDTDASRAVRWRTKACSDQGLTVRSNDVSTHGPRSGRSRREAPGSRSGRDGRRVHRAVPSGRPRQPRCRDASGPGDDGRAQSGAGRPRVLRQLSGRARLVAGRNRHRRGTGRLHRAVSHAVPPQRGISRRLPDRRGRGLVDDLLGEVTRIHAASGAERITATTDLTNLPMAAAFERAGYAVTEIRLILEAPR